MSININVEISQMLIVVGAAADRPVPVSSSKSAGREAPVRSATNAALDQRLRDTLEEVLKVRKTVSKENLLDFLERVRDTRDPAMGQD